MSLFHRSFSYATAASSVWAGPTTSWMGGASTPDDSENAPRLGDYVLVEVERVEDKFKLKVWREQTLQYTASSPDQLGALEEIQRAFEQEWGEE